MSQCHRTMWEENGIVQNIRSSVLVCECAHLWAPVYEKKYKCIIKLELWHTILELYVPNMFSSFRGRMEAIKDSSQSAILHFILDTSLNRDVSVANPNKWALQFLYHCLKSPPLTHSPFHTLFFSLGSKFLLPVTLSLPNKLSLRFY